VSSNGGGVLALSRLDTDQEGFSGGNVNVIPSTVLRTSSVAKPNPDAPGWLPNRRLFPVAGQILHCVQDDIARRESNVVAIA
jgi:hypothetical protein